MTFGSGSAVETAVNGHRSWFYSYLFVSFVCFVGNLSSRIFNV